MSDWDRTPFSQLLVDSKDGEWGEAEEGVGLREAIIIRGTDFANLDNPSAELSRRWVAQHIVKRKHLQPGDIILETAGGTSTQSTGRSALLKQSFFQHYPDMPVLCASFSRHLRLDTSRFSPRFVYYMLQMLHRSGYMAVFNIQHTGVSRFQYTAFKHHTEVQIPELPLQRRIAGVLSAYDELIENNTKQIVLLEQIGEEIYLEWFVRLRFPGHETAEFVKGIPQNWDQTRFDKFCTLKRGYDLPDASVEPGEYPVIAATSVKTYHQEFKVEPPVITTGRSGTLGTVLMIHTRAWPLNTVLYVKDHLGNSPFLIFYTLKHMALENFNSGAGVPTLNRNHLASLTMVVPTRDLQKDFDAVISPLHEKRELLLKTNITLSRSRSVLLGRLISGKLSIENLDIHLSPGIVEELKPVQAAIAHA